MKSSVAKPLVMVVYGTRPEAIKVAPIIKQIEKSDKLGVFTVATAQHREMLDQVNRAFGITPDRDLNLMTHGQTLNQIASRVLFEIDVILEAIKPAAVLVQGDTTTVMAAGIAAFNRRIPVVHLEAGLRTGDINSPFPEEANRRIVSQIAALHLAPTTTSRDNLTREGIDGDAITVTGNTVIDALLWAVEQAVDFDDHRLTAAKSSGKRVILLTTHRRENLGPNMVEIGRAVQDIAATYPDVTIVWPAHKNPAVRNALEPILGNLPNVIQTEPADYLQFCQLQNMASIILSDSGGVQEEAPSLGKPVLVLRENTERPEAIEAGTARLIGTSRRRIVEETSRLLNDSDYYDSMANAVNPFGDGTAAAQSVSAMEKLLTCPGLE